MQATTHCDVSSYIAAQPAAAQALLQQIREAVQAAAPQAVECISYGIPTFKLGGKVVVHFAAFKNHIGFYATPTGHAAFAQELSAYKQGKGSVQFPLKQPLPLALITRIATFRAAQVAGTLPKKQPAKKN